MIHNGLMKTHGMDEIEGGVILQYLHSFCGYGTHSIGTIKCDISTIICDIGTIKVILVLSDFFIYINLSNK